MNKTKVQFADMLAEQKATFDKKVSDIYNFVNTNLDPVLGLFDEIAATDEGKALLKKLREDKQAKTLSDIQEADKEQPEVKGNKEKKERTRSGNPKLMIFDYNAFKKHKVAK